MREKRVRENERYQEEAKGWRQRREADPINLTSGTSERNSFTREVPRKGFIIVWAELGGRGSSICIKVYCTSFHSPRGFSVQVPDGYFEICHQEDKIKKKTYK